MQKKNKSGTTGRLWLLTGLLWCVFSGLAVADSYDIKLDSPSVTEGGDLTFTVQLVDPTDNTVLKAANGEQVLVDWTTSDAGLAQSGSDYNSDSGTLTFNPGDNSTTIVIPTLSDNDVESDETLHLIFSNGRTNPAGGTVDWAASNETDGTIVNDDKVTLTLSGPSGKYESSGNYQFTLTLDQAITDSNVTATIDYATSDGTASAGTDYSDTSGSGLDLATGATSFSINVPLTDNSTVDGDKDFSLSLSNPTANVTINTSSITGTILDDDHNISIVPSVPPQAESAGDYPFEITLSPPLRTGEVASVNYATSDGTAVAGADYTAVNQDIAFTDSSTNPVTVNIPIIDDTDVERDETFSVTIGTGSGTTTGDLIVSGINPAVGTLNNDDKVTLTLSGPSGKYESSGNYQFTLTLDQAITDSNVTATIDYATSDGTASAGTDYSDTSGSGLDLATGATSFSINVPLTDNSTVDGDKDFSLSLSNPTANVTISTSSITGAILDDDHTISIAPSVPSQAESAGDYPFTITVSPPLRTGEVASVNYATGDGTAIAGTDYTTVNQDISFTDSTANPVTVNIPIIDDNDVERDETFYVTINTGSGTTTGNLTVTGTNPAEGVIDNDNVVNVTLSAPARQFESEGDYTVTLTLDHAITDNNVVATIDYSTTDNSALAGSDYTDNDGTGFNLATGATEFTFDIPILDDGISESIENFIFELANPTGNVNIVDSSVTVTIVDDDHSVSVVPVHSEQPETDAVYPFTISISPPVASGESVSVGYATIPGTADGGGVDYDSGSDELVFTDPLVSEQTVNITIREDTLYEGDENFTVSTFTGSGSTTGTLTHGSGTGVITDPYTISINDVTVEEEYTDTVMTTVTVTLDRQNTNDANPITVDFSTDDTGTATAIAGTDFTAKTGTLTFDSTNPQSQVIDVEILADQLIENPGETFFIKLFNRTPADDAIVIGDDSGTVTINDNTNDYLITVLPDFTYEEGDGDGTAKFRFQVDKAVPAGQNIILTYTTTDGTAVAGSDYTALSGTYTISGPQPALSTHTFSVPVNPDGTLEGPEDFFMDFTAVSDNFTFAGDDNRQKCTIQDHDFTVGFTGSVSVSEDGNNTATPPEKAVFTVKLDRPPQGDEIVTVDYATSDGTALQGSDYVSTSGTLTFCANPALPACPVATTDLLTFTVDIVDDAVGENLESFNVSLSNSSLNTLIDPTKKTVQGQITDDDYNVSSFSDASVAEDVGNVILTIQLDRPVNTGDEVVLEYSTIDGTVAPILYNNKAVAGEDYTAAVNHTVTIGPGQDSATITIPILDDSLVEFDEKFSVLLTGTTNSSGDPLNVNTGGNDTATVTIGVDEKYTFAINDINIVEQDTIAHFTVSITPAIRPEHYYLLVMGVQTVDGTATAPDDYTEVSSSTILLSGGISSYDLGVQIKDDVLDEGSSEFFLMNITSIYPSEIVEIVDSQGKCTILDTEYFITPTWNEPGGTVTLESPVGTDKSIASGSPVGIVDAVESVFTITADHFIEDIIVLPMDSTHITINQSSPTLATVTFDSSTPDRAYTLDVVFSHLLTLTANSAGTVERVSPAPPESVSDGTRDILMYHHTDQLVSFTGHTDQCVSELTIDGVPQTAFKAENVNWDLQDYLFTSVEEDHSVEATFGQARITVLLQADQNSSDTNTIIQNTATWSACAASDATFSTCTEFLTGKTHGEHVVVPLDISCDTQFIRISFSDDVDSYTRPSPIDINLATVYGNDQTVIGTEATDTVDDVIVTGVYTAFTHQLLVNVTGMGSVTLDPEPEYTITEGRYAYTTGTAVELTAAPDPGWAFSIWSGDAGGTTTPVTVTMDLDRSVDVLFVEGCQDLDNDGFSTGDVNGTGCTPTARLDCNDNDAAINPDATEICEDGIDQDCSGDDLICSGDDADDDGDGWTENQGDCDDTDQSIAPGLYDIPGDGIDQDCYNGDREIGSEVTCVDVTDDPVNAAMRPAPPLIMFLMDDSGSMDWEFMTNEGNGLYSNRYYLLAYDSDTVGYSTGGRLDSGQRREFESQWSRYNRLYYDPEVRYQPWPQWETIAGDATSNEQTADPDGYIHADMDTPRMNTSEVTHAWNGTYRYNLNETYFSVAAGGAGQQIIVTRHSGSSGSSTCADAVGLSTNPNLELTSSEYWYLYDGTPPAPEFIFDNKDGSTVFSTSPGWRESGGSSRWEWAGSAYYENDNGDWAKWMLNLDAADEGDYYVYVWNDDYSGRDRNAKYTVFHYVGDQLQSSDFYVDQRGMDYGGDGQKWHRLGNSTFHFKGQSAAPSTINVPVAHYFRWFDANANDVRENGEVYLITIPGSGRNIGDYELHYYRFNDVNGDDKVDDGELVELTGSDIPIEIIPIRYDNNNPANLILDPTDPADLADADKQARLALQERQNFADWFSFYRRRILTAKSAVGLTVADMSGMELGIHTINRSFSRKLTYIDKSSSAELTGFLHDLYDLRPSGYTPLRRGLYDVGTYFEETNTGDNYWRLHTEDGTDTSVFYTAENGGECQRAYVIAMTDGYYNGSFDMPGSPDNRDGQSYQPIIFQDSAQDTLADIAIRFYDEDLDSDLDNLLPAKNFDMASHQHMVTFGVSFGVFGNYDPTLFPDCLPECVPGENGCPTIEELTKRDCILSNGSFVCGPGTGPFEKQCPEWYPVRRNTNQTIDDLYHASINGRGKFLNAANPAELVKSMKTIKDLIVEQTGTASSVALNAKEIREGALLFQTVYDTQGWAGDLLAKCLSATGEVERCAVTECEKSCNDAYAVWMEANCPDGEDSCRSTGEMNRLDCLEANRCNCGAICPVVEGLCEDSCAAEVASCNITCDQTWDCEDTDTVCLNGLQACQQTCSDNDTVCMSECSSDLASCLSDPACEDTNEDNTNVKWSASKILDPDPTSRFDDTAWKARDIITSTDGSTPAGIPFLWDNLTSSMKLALDPTPGTPDAALQKAILEYIRGEDQYEKSSDSSHLYDFRDRGSKIGDIIHSEPYHFADLGMDWVFVGANDGMLHVFKGDTGEELFAYIPHIILNNLHQLADQSFNENHKYFVDGYVATRDVGNRTILVGGLGKGGKGYYSLNLTAAKAHIDDIEGAAADVYNWEYSNIYKPHDPTVDASNPDNDLGWSFSRPQIVKSRDEDDDAKYILVFGNGYESVNCKAVLYLVGMDEDGQVVWEKKIDTGVGDSTSNCNGLSTPGLIDPDLDGYIDFAYAGDLLGNMWKFDLRSSDRSEWKVYHSDGTNPQPLFQAKSEAGFRQPITSKPDVMGFCRPDAAGYMVIFGTGRLLGTDDFADNSVQTLYGIYDWGPAWENIGTNEGVDKYYGSFGAELSATEESTCASNCLAVKSTCYSDCAGNSACEELCDEQKMSCQDNCGRLRSLSNMANIVTNGSKYVTLLQQTQTWIGGIKYNSDGSISDQKYWTTGTVFNEKLYDEVISILSDNQINWLVPAETSETITTPRHVGWYFDLPTNGARIINNVQIIDGKVISTNSIPSDSPCEGGGQSFHFVTNACDGGRTTGAFFDLNGDGLINESDYINIGTAANPILVAPSAVSVGGLSPAPTIFEGGGRGDGPGIIIYPSNEADNQGIGPQLPTQGIQDTLGIFYWRELIWQ